jgi:hypothetical protein
MEMLCDRLKYIFSTGKSLFVYDYQPVVCQFILRMLMTGFVFFLSGTQVLLSLHEMFPAVHAAEMAVKRNPHSWEAWQTLGRAQLGLGEIVLVRKLDCYNAQIEVYFDLQSRYFTGACYPSLPDPGLLRSLYPPFFPYPTLLLHFVALDSFTFVSFNVYRDDFI